MNGKSVLVTAAAAGIGRACALRIAAEGARVVAVDIDERGLATLSGENGIEVRCLDVTDFEAVQRFAGEPGAFDGLVNCVGYVASGTVLESEPDEWARSLRVNVTSCYHMTRAFLPQMLERGGGAIVNVASIVSSLKAAPSRCCYGTAKAALIGLTKSVAIDFVARRVRCNAICPGTVDTPSLQQRLYATGDYAKARKGFEARQPMGRIAHVDEISPLVAFLISDESSFITGQAYPVDGGWSI